MQKQHRSVSQVNQYKRCPYAYKLARIDKVWQRPAAWLAQGSAVHEAGEVWEKSGRTMTLEQAQRTYSESYDSHIGESTEITPNFSMWSWSGPYDGKTDIERRYNLGMDQVGRMFDWYIKHPNEVPWITPDGVPAIELGFDIELGGIPVRGYIDLVMTGVDHVQAPIVRDNKTGNSPGDDFQLGTYAVALRKQYGVEVVSGDYWMGRSGKPTYAYDLRDWTEEAVTEVFQELEENIQAENFEPDPEPSKCRFCDVSASCSFVVS